MLQQWKFESLPQQPPSLPPPSSSSMCPKDLGLISDSFHLDGEEKVFHVEEEAAAAASIYSVNQDECACSAEWPPLSSEAGGNQP